MVKGSDMISSDSNSILKTIVIILFVAGIAYLIYYLYNQNSHAMTGSSIKSEQIDRMNNMQGEEQQYQKQRMVSEENIASVNYKMNGCPDGQGNPIMTKKDTLQSGHIVGEVDVEHFSQNQGQKYTDERNASSFPKDQLTAEELLPQDNSSLWAQVNPSGEGSLKDRNFLQSGYHIGINTVGQTLRNANLQLRSEPPCPQVKVSPWGQSTIDGDLSRKPFEIGGCA